MKSARSCGGFKKKSKALGKSRKDACHKIFIDIWENARVSSRVSEKASRRRPSENMTCSCKSDCKSYRASKNFESISKEFVLAQVILNVLPEWGLPVWGLFYYMYMYAQSMRGGRRVPGFFGANVARPRQSVSKEPAATTYCVYNNYYVVATYMTLYAWAKVICSSLNSCPSY